MSLKSAISVNHKKSESSIANISTTYLDILTLLAIGTAITFSLPSLEMYLLQHVRIGIYLKISFLLLHLRI